MWGMIGALVDFVCLAAIAILWIRMAVVHRRHGLKIFTVEPWRSVSKPDRRPLMRAIRRGESVPPACQGVAREWAGRERLRRGIAWQAILVLPVLANGMPDIFESPGPLWRVGFWFSMVMLCLLIASAVLLWRDQRIAARLLRDTAPTA